MHLPRSVFWICWAEQRLYVVSGCILGAWYVVHLPLCVIQVSIPCTTLNTQPFCNHSSQVIDNAPKDLLLSMNGPAYSCDQSNQSNQAKNKLKLVWSLLYVRSEIMLGECVCVCLFRALTQRAGWQVTWPKLLLGKPCDKTPFRGRRGFNRQ